MKIKSIIKLFSFSSLSSIVNIISGVIITKIIALYAGPSGLAVVGQFRNYNSIQLTLSNLGTQEGIIQSIASKRNKEDKLKFLKTIYPLVVIVSLLITLIALIFSKNIARILWGNLEYVDVIYFSSLTLMILTFNSLFLLILNANEMYSQYVKLNVLINLIGVIVSLVLMHYYDIRGALYAVFLSKIFLTYYTYSILKKNDLIVSFFDFKAIDSKIVMFLLSFSLMKLVTIFTNPITKIYTRSKIDNKLSSFDAGLWEGLNQISEVVGMFFTISLSLYYLPTLSKTLNVQQLKNIISSNLFIVGMVSFFILSTIYLLKSFIIELLFDESFLPMTNMFFYQFVGDFFKIISLMYGYLFWAKKLTQSFIFFEIFFSVIYILLIEISFSIMITDLNIPFVYMVKNGLYLISIIVFMNIKLNQLYSS